MDALPMKIYNEQFSLQSQKQREVFNITTRVKAALEKSGLREGILLVSSLESNTAIILNAASPQAISDLDERLDEFSPDGDASAPTDTNIGLSEAAGKTRFPTFALSRQIVISFSENRLELGNDQAVLFLEFDGRHPRSVAIKMIGE